ncbi:hypothetical protein, partial [Streptococcus pseudopneumoniae]|uniref:hypothetical protein n=1 Tax=Streptococcus pseudopneumoniae TaxID=257758 RepID=UPI0019D5A6C6
VFNSLTGQVATFTLLFAALVLALSLWVYGQRPKTITLALVLITLIGSGVSLHRLSQPAASHYQPWSAAAVQAAQGTQPVFVD